jgi:Ca2+-binding EF-hand superfamily protein
MPGKLSLVLGLVILLADAASVLAQPGSGPGGGFPGGGRGGPGGRGGFGGQGFDPAQIFDQFAGGKNVVSRDDIDPNNRFALRIFDRVTQSLNITNNQITREQFVTGFDQMRQNFGRGGPGGRGNGDQGPGGRGQGQSFDEMAEAQFKQLDKNNDGFLNTDEMPGNLRTQLARWDTNKDNLIDLQEFKAYLRDQTRQGPNLPAVYELANVPDPEEDRRPVVYNAKNFPKELPAWFKQLDTDGDGQIGLYEWRRSGRSIEEFMAIDRNNDGFLTVEEVLYSMAVARKSGKASENQMASFIPGNGSAMNNGSANDTSGGFNFPGRGPFGGKGQFGGKGPFGGRGGNGPVGGRGGDGQFAGGPPSGGGDQPQIGSRRGRGGPGGSDNGNGGGFGKKGRRGGNGPGGNGSGG